MKVLMLTTHLNTGGVARYILALSEGLAKSGVDVSVMSAGGGMEGFFGEKGIRHQKIGIKTKFEFHPKLIAASAAAAGYVKKNGVNIIHAHTRVAQVVSCVASRATGIPFVSTCHGFFRAERLSRKLIGCWGSGVIAISEPVKRHLTEDFRLPEKDITVIHTGIDTARFTADVPPAGRLRLRSEHGLGDGPVIGTVGRLSPVKGHDVLVRAFKTVRAGRPGAKLLIVGSGPFGDELRRIAAVSGVEKDVIFVEEAVDTAEYLRIMDVFAFPSRQEGLGLALLEAMASGLPCAASAAGGIKDIITDGVTGVLCPPGDAGKLAGAISALLNDGAFAGGLAGAARSKVAGEFGIGGTVKKTIEFYEGVIGAQ